MDCSHASYTEKVSVRLTSKNNFKVKNKDIKTKEQMCANLTLPTPQNGQTQSNNSSVVADELLSVFGHFVGWRLED